MGNISMKRVKASDFTNKGVILEGWGELKIGTWERKTEES